MPQQVRRRRQRTVDYDANNVVSEPLGRGMVYRELYLKLTCQPTLTATNNTVANTERGGEWAVVKKIEVIANNTDVLRSFSGNALRWLNYFFYGIPPRLSPALGDGASANPSCESVLVVPFWMPRSIKPMDTALDSRELSDLKIQVTWGTYTDINATATGWTTNPQMQIHSLESFLVEGPFSQSRIYTIQSQVNAANAQHQVLLPVGPMYRAFMVLAVSDGAEVGTILNNMKVISGSTVFADVPEFILQMADNLRTGRFHSWDTGGHQYDTLHIAGKNDLAGAYYYDHVTDGYMKEAIDTLGFSEFMLELDVNHPGTTDMLEIYPVQIIPVRGG